MSEYVLSIDAGTTGVTILLFDRAGEPIKKLYSEFPQYYPRPGWVEHDAEEIWAVTQRLLRELVAEIPPADIAGIGITNQRETTVLWDRETGRPLSRAIVWQCRRTADLCRKLKEEGRESLFREKTGLVIDAYFSATKIQWLLEHVPAVSQAAREGRALFGTVDTWLLWKLTGGRVHATDYTNASRTLIFNIHDRTWDAELLDLLGIPQAILPDVRPSSGDYGHAQPDIMGAEVPVAGIAGDQQAALFGQGGVRPGDMKNTYGTGCFVLLNTGTEAVESRCGLVTTLTPDERGNPVYALEGSVFIAGAVIQWLRDGLGLIASAAESEKFAREVPDTHGLYLVPAFVGLGAPYWDMDARGGMLGITRGVTRAHVVRAALEAIAYETRDLLEAMKTDFSGALTELRVDGGAAENDFLMQFQADVLGMRVLRPRNIETTALGAAYLAGLGVGFWKDWSDIEALRAVEQTFDPEMDMGQREILYGGWKAAVARVLSSESAPAGA
jgi:glycerol kinase